MSKLEKNLTEILDLEPTEVSNSTSNTAIVVSSPIQPPMLPPTAAGREKDINEDYSKSRKNLDNLIEMGNDALQKLMDLSMESEHPRAWEVFAQQFKNMTEANKELLETQKRMNEVSELVEEEDPSGGLNIDKAIIFSGKPEEFQRLMKQNIKEFGPDE